MVGKDAAQKERQVAEAAVQDEALVGRHREDELGELRRVELAEALVPPAAPALDPERAAGHVGVRGQQVGHEEPAQRVGHELAQRLHLEHRHGAATADPLGHEAEPLEDGRRLRQQHGERRERAGHDDRILLGALEQRAEHLGPGEQPVDVGRSLAQAGGPLRQRTRLTGGCGQQRQIGVGEAFEKQELGQHGFRCSRFLRTHPQATGLRRGWRRWAWNHSWCGGTGYSTVHRNR